MADKEIKRPITTGVAKVPVVMQMDSLESGAAALAMILAYYDKWIPIEQIREDCGVSRDGSNAKSVLQTARIYSMKADSNRLSPEQLRKEGKFPMIIQWKLNRFIVLNGFKGDEVYVNDPARGSIKLTYEEFENGYTGDCLLFEPGEGFVPSGKRKSVLKFARERLRGASSSVIFVSVTTLIASVTGIIMSGFSRVFIDRLLSGTDPDWLYPFIIGLSVVVAVQIIASWIRAMNSLLWTRSPHTFCREYPTKHRQSLRCFYPCSR